MKAKLFPVAFLAALLITMLTGVVSAQRVPPMGIPIPTTLILTKPAPGQIYGDKPVVTIGVGTKTFRFVLKDAYTNHRLIHWPDIWQQVNQFNPNFNAAGIGEDQFAKIQPGQTVTVNGMFAVLDRTFEVMSVQESGGGEHY